MFSDDRYINLKFPFEEDTRGKYLRLTNTDKEAVRSNLSFFITTQRGERLYKPNFGTNIPRFIFEPMDEQTYGEIREEIVSSITQYFQNIRIENVETNVDEKNLFVGIRISYSISQGAFKERDEINLTF